jgi:exodeoxyribonuclease V beta subunit
VALRTDIATCMTGCRHAEGTTDAAPLRYRRLHRSGWGPWRVSSYSALAGGHHNPVDHDAQDDLPNERPEKGSVYDFPRGARAGTFLHAVLEHLDFHAPDSPEALQRIARLQRRYGIDPSWNDLLGRWLAEVVRTPLDDQGLTLSLIEPGRRLNELGFFFRCGEFGAEALNRLLADFAWPTATPLEFSRMEGMLTGQIDLVFEHAGRYYLADYKSNDLGPSAAHYHDRALARAMASRRYDLQYLIYTIALHRHLRMRLPDYDPERHLGGVFYLFLRGMRGPVADGAGNGVYATRLPGALIEALDHLFDGAGEGA